jgi:hypothetical protein
MASVLHLSIPTPSLPIQMPIGLDVLIPADQRWDIACSWAIISFLGPPDGSPLFLDPVSRLNIMLLLALEPLTGAAASYLQYLHRLLQ